MRTLVRESEDTSIGEYRYARDGRELVYLVLDQGYSRLMRKDLRSLVTRWWVLPATEACFGLDVLPHARRVLLECFDQEAGTYLLRAVALATGRIDQRRAHGRGSLMGLRGSLSAAALLVSFRWSLGRLDLGGLTWRPIEGSAGMRHGVARSG